MRTDQAYTGSQELVLAVSLELAAAKWKVALHDGRREQPAVHTVAQPQAAARLQAVLDLIEQQRLKWSLPAGVRLVVSYEAGQDAFWICRALQARGIECYVVDPASIPVERHKRRAKTDRLDAIKLVINLRAWLRGERDRMHVVHVPSPQDEASRQLMRDRGELQKARQASLPAPARKRCDDLARLKGIGEVGASRLALELFWREFSNRRQVGACVGLVPQPYDSGESHTDQGISRQGNRRVRALLVEMAWCWLRYQPDSALTQWFNQRTQGTATNRRARRIAIVAVARRLAIALWRYLKDGVIPDGAQLKPA